MEIGKLTTAEMTELIKAEQESEKRFKQYQEELLDDLQDVKSYILTNKRELAIKTLDRQINSLKSDLKEPEFISVFSDKRAYEIDKEWEER